MPVYKEPEIPGWVKTSRRPIEYLIAATGCWECTSHKADNKGYPKLRRYNGYYRMNRYVYECEFGDIPEGLHVMHTCDNPLCMNPEHLKLGTPADNMRDMVDKGRSLAGSRNIHAKLTEADVISIRKDSRSLRAIAKTYGVAFSIIHKIKKGILWKHVKELDGNA